MVIGQTSRFQQFGNLIHLFLGFQYFHIVFESPQQNIKSDIYIAPNHYLLRRHEQNRVVT
jgi:hypothetical protein